MLVVAAGGVAQVAVARVALENVDHLAGGVAAQGDGVPARSPGRWSARRSRADSASARRASGSSRSTPTAALNRMVLVPAVASCGNRCNAAQLPRAGTHRRSRSSPARPWPDQPLTRRPPWVMLSSPLGPRAWLNTRHPRDDGRSPATDPTTSSSGGSWPSRTRRWGISASAGADNYRRADAWITAAGVRDVPESGDRAFRVTSGGNFCRFYQPGILLPLADSCSTDVSTKRMSPG